MENLIAKLIKSYIDFYSLISEYTVLNDRLKTYTKEHHNNVIVDYYSLKIKLIDKSIYSQEVLSYLLKNNLNNFIEKEVDDKKIKNLIQANALDRNFVLSSINSEKTYIDIKLNNYNDYINSLKNRISNNIENLDILNIIKRRESLKLEIGDLRYMYYRNAKEVKSKMLCEELPKYRFKYKDSIGILKIETSKRLYSNQFVNYLESNNLDAFKYNILNKKLNDSKNKKIDRDYIEQFKQYNYQEQLYIVILKGLFNKKFKNIRHTVSN